MKNKFLAAAAFAVALVPAIASAETFYDPATETGSSPFVALPTMVNPANAAAAAADAQRYQGVSGNVLIGTHGAAPQAVIEYDPGIDSNSSPFVTKVIVPDAAPVPISHHYIPYADNSDVIGD